MEQSINIIEMLFDYGMKLCRSKKHLLIGSSGISVGKKCRFPL